MQAVPTTRCMEYISSSKKCIGKYNTSLMSGYNTRHIFRYFIMCLRYNNSWGSLPLGIWLEGQTFSANSDSWTYIRSGLFVNISHLQRNHKYMLEFPTSDETDFLNGLNTSGYTPLEIKITLRKSYNI